MCTAISHGHRLLVAVLIGLFVHPVVGWFVRSLITLTTLILQSTTFVTELNQLYVGLVYYEVCGSFNSFKYNKLNMITDDVLE